jgi:hypothetical protein
MESKSPITAEDVPAVLRVFSRYVALFLRNRLDVAQLKEIQSRLEADKEQFSKLQTAFEVFGVDINKGGFTRIRETVGEQTFLEAVNSGRAMIGLPPASNPDTSDGINEAPRAEIASPDQYSTAGQEAEEPSTLPVRELTLRCLKAAFPEGKRASEIRDEVEAARAEELHEKTVGMTLYRLSQAEPPLARRDGMKWFYVPPKAETKNPDAPTPGSNDVFA